MDKPGRVLGRRSGQSAHHVRRNRHAEIHRHCHRPGGAEKHLGASRGRRRAPQQRRRRDLEPCGSHRPQGYPQRGCDFGPPKTVFILANRELYASTDDGAIWEARRMQTTLPWDCPRKETYLRGIAVDAADPKGMFLGFGDFTPGSSGAIARSNDLGKSWRLLPCRWSRTRRYGPSVSIAQTRPSFLPRADMAISTAATAAENLGPSSGASSAKLPRYAGCGIDAQSLGRISEFRSS